MTEQEVHEHENVVVVHTDVYRRPFIILIVVVCVSLASYSILGGLIWKVTNNTNTIVKDVQFRNSPENQKAQGLIIQTIIDHVDCNSRRAIEDAFNKIVQEHPDFAKNIDITSTSCDAFTTTSTSAPP